MQSNSRLLGPGEFERRAKLAARALHGSADSLVLGLSLNLFRVTNRLQRDLETHVYRNSGISGAAYSLMFVIKTVGPVSPKELAHLSSTSTAATSSLLNTLEKYGFITRTASETDGRKVIVALTPSGEHKLAETFALSHAREAEWAASLTDTEAAILLELLRKLLLWKPQSDSGVAGPSPSEQQAHLIADMNVDR